MCLPRSWEESPDEHGKPSAAVKHNIITAMVDFRLRAMVQSIRRLRTLPLVALACICGPLVTSGASAKTKLVVWGLPSGEWTRGRDATIAEFMRRHPDIEVVSLSMGAGGMNPQKLMTSIVGGVPPDLVHQDRFTIGDWASRDAFRALDDLIAHDTGPGALRFSGRLPHAGGLGRIPMCSVDPHAGVQWSMMS